MSSVIDPHPEQPAAEELVAYLDGELPPEECRRVEERLAKDADYRRQLRDLDRAWEALDVLPARQANDDFARTTMELVTVAARSDATAVTATAATARRRHKTWFVAAALAGAALGFVLASLVLPDRNQALLNDLPVIRRYETLGQIESVDFLRRLADEVSPEQLSDEVAIDNELEQMASLDARRAWVEGLSPEDKVILAAQVERFGKLDDDRKDALRALNQQASDADLEPMLLAYDHWLSRLTAGQREDLRQNFLDRPVDQQVELVRRFVRQENEQAARRLSNEDAAILRRNLAAIAVRYKVSLKPSQRPGGNDERNTPPGALTMIARELFRNDNTRNELREQLTNDLSAKARAQLESLSGWRRNEQLWRWIRDALQSRVDSDDLERFFAEKLDTEQREKLLSLPPSEMQARLERLYYASELGYGDVAQWWRQLRDSGWPSNRPGDDRPGVGPDGPPGERGRRDGPRDFFDRERMRPRPGGPPPPRDADFPDGRGPFGPPPHDPRPGDPRPGPPPRDNQPPPEET